MLAALIGRIVVPVEQHTLEEPAGPGGVELHFGVVPAQLLDVAGGEDVDGGETVADDRLPLVGLVFLSISLSFRDRFTVSESSESCGSYTYLELR